MEKLVANHKDWQVQRKFGTFKWDILKSYFLVMTLLAFFHVS